MESPYVTLHTQGRGDFSWNDGYERSADIEVEILLRQARSALSSLEAEYEKRRLGKHYANPSSINDCCEKLLKGAEKLRVLERLDDRGSRLVDNAVKTLTESQTTRDSKIYQLFLTDVLRHSGPGLVLLYAASLGKQRVANLITHDRIGLLRYVRDNKPSLYCPALGPLAEGHQIPSANDKRLADGDVDLENVFGMKSIYCQVLPSQIFRQQILMGIIGVIQRSDRR